MFLLFFFSSHCSETSFHFFLHNYINTQKQEIFAAETVNWLSSNGWVVLRSHNWRTANARARRCSFNVKQCNVYSIIWMQCTYACIQCDTYATLWSCKRASATAISKPTQKKNNKRNGTQSWEMWFQNDLSVTTCFIGLERNLVFTHIDLIETKVEFYDLTVGAFWPKYFHRPEILFWFWEIIFVWSGLLCGHWGCCAPTQTGPKVRMYRRIWEHSEIYDRKCSIAIGNETFQFICCWLWLQFMCVRCKA